MSIALDNLARDVRYSARGLARNPLFTLVAAGLTLVAALASHLPARRASAVASAESLAAE